MPGIALLEWHDSVTGKRHQAHIAVDVARSRVVSQLFHRGWCPQCGLALIEQVDYYARDASIWADGVQHDLILAEVGRRALHFQESLECDAAVRLGVWDAALRRM